MSMVNIIKVETTGMDPHLEDSVKEVILSMYSHNYVT